MKQRKGQQKDGEDSEAGFVEEGQIDYDAGGDDRPKPGESALSTLSCNEP
jgi:hypothetical protein